MKGVAMDIALNFSKNFEILLDMFAERICNKKDGDSPITKEEVFKMAGALVAESRETAKNTVEEISVTQADLKVLETNTKAEFQSVRAEMQEFKAETKAEFQSVRAEMKAMESNLRGEMKAMETNILKWFIGVQIASIGAITAIIKLL